MELFRGASVRSVITQVAPSARVMPVSASPARKSARNRPDLQKAGGRKAGDICQLPCATQAISAGFTAPRFPALLQQWSAPVASSLRASPVVTMRAMPQPARTFRWLAQVTTPRDGLPDPSSSSGSRNVIRPHARSPRAQCKAAPRNDNSGRPSEPWVNGSPRCSGFQQEDIIDAKNGCSRGKQQKTLHKSGVVSRVPCRSRHAQRSGRTETLTGQAAHTSRNAELERTGITSNRR